MEKLIREEALVLKASVYIQDLPQRMIYCRAREAINSNALDRSRKKQQFEFACFESDPDYCITSELYLLHRSNNFLEI